MTEKSKAPYPYFSINGEYMDKDFLDSVWDHLITMSKIWDSGIDDPSPADKLAYIVMKQISSRGVSKFQDGGPS
jgi:hypothetical protein